jgi:predicted RNA-binding protein (TIGR00451 family)
MNEDIERIRAIADYQFGKNAGKVLFPDDTKIEYSKNTNRPRHLYIGDIMIANFRATDALFTLTIAGAKRLNNLEGLTGYVVVIDDVLEFIENGKNLFAKHVTEAGPGIRSGDEVIIRDTSGSVAALGKAELTSEEMNHFKNGQAVDVRRGRKRHR